jgi:hypothetical protein
VPRFNRLTLSIAGTAAVALASLPLGITPANAARISEGTSSSIGVMEAAGNASQFNWSVNNGQSVAQSLAVETEGRGRGRGGRGNASRQTGSWLDRLFEFLGINTTNSSGRNNQNNPLD